MISAAITVLLAASVSSANLRVDGHAVARDAVFHGKHSVRLAKGDVRPIDGDLVIRRRGRGFRVVAKIPLEDYVAAALETEAPHLAEREALKAMAVAVRTYAAANLHRHGRVADVCDGTHCQRIRFPASKEMREAAEATRSQLVLYESKPARVVYHQNCGGITASAASVWGGNGVPYLVSAKDPYCQRRPLSWRTKVAKATLERVVSKDGKAPLKLQVAGRNSSGRVSTVRSATASWTGTKFRELISRITGPAGFRSVRFKIFEAADHFTFVGSGAGHGVGLCQSGAVARAEDGHDYRAILAAYFPHTSVAAQ